MGKIHPNPLKFCISQKNTYICSRNKKNDRGDRKSPLCLHMITVQSITQLVEEKLIGTDRFIISVKVSPNKRIEVLLDGLSNIAISDCIDMSRHIEGSLDREQEDFELMVSSAGIDEAFVVEKQYQKNIGREVDVVKKDGNKVNGKLISHKEAEAIVVESSKTVKDEKKKKQIITEQITIPLQEIKETKLVLSFK